MNSPASLPEDLEKRGYAEDPRAILTHGRLVMRPRQSIEDPAQGTIQKTLVGGILLGDLGFPGDEDELWLCEAVLLVPMQKFRGFNQTGQRIDQMLVGYGMHPQSYREEIPCQKNT
jgi:hypothetical protein